jgi:hypothetical protein
MTRTALALIALLSTTPALAQPGPYGGPPMWDRGRNPEMERPRPLPPMRRPYGPQMEPCIRLGECRGPQRDYDNLRTYPRPRYPEYDE